MTPRPRLPDLTIADAGKRFVMRPGSVRTLLILVGSEGPEAAGPVRVEGPLTDEASRMSGALRRYRVVAVERGSASVTVGETTWSFEVRGPRLVPDQTSDDTDAGWGESHSGHTRAFWDEQRPPHWG